MTTNETKKQYDNERELFEKHYMLNKFCFERQIKLNMQIAEVNALLQNRVAISICNELFAALQAEHENCKKHCEEAVKAAKKALALAEKLKPEEIDYRMNQEMACRLRQWR